MIEIVNEQKPMPKNYHDGYTLNVHSRAETIQGEGPYAGCPAAFIRLAGCNLQCPRCDTEYTPGKDTHLRAIRWSTHIKEDNAPHVFTPLINSTKAQVIDDAYHNVPGLYQAFSMTHTAYIGKEKIDTDKIDAATRTRNVAFAQAGVPDPAILVEREKSKTQLPPTDNYSEDKVSEAWEIMKHGNKLYMMAKLEQEKKRK